MKFGFAQDFESKRLLIQSWWHLLHNIECEGWWTLVQLGICTGIPVSEPRSTAYRSGTIPKIALTVCTEIMKVSKDYSLYGQKHIMSLLWRTFTRTYRDIRYGDFAQNTPASQCCIVATAEVHLQICRGE